MKKLISIIVLLVAGTAYAVDNPFSSLTALGNNLAAGDLFAVTDISDTTQSANGTTKKIVASDVGLFFISDTAWSGSVWNGITGIAPSKNAVYDYLHLMAAADDGKVSQLNTAAAGFVPTNSSGVIGTARVITAGTAVSVTNGDGSAGNPTVNFDPTGLTGNRTWGNGSNASLTWTWDLSGTDPVLTVGSGVLNVTTGALQVGGVNVTTDSGTTTLTNKTFDASGTGNILKMRSLPQFITPGRTDGTNCTVGTTINNTLGGGLPTFSNSVDQASNYCEYRFIVPSDWDTAVDPTVRLTDLIGADTGARRYVMSVLSVAASASATGAPSTAINIDMAADASGVSGDIELSGSVTLTGWGTLMTPGQMMIIRLARDGDQPTQDASSVNSTLISFELSYAATQ